MGDSNVPAPAHWAKRGLRTQLRAQRDAIDPKQRARRSVELAQALAGFIKRIDAANTARARPLRVASYAAIGSEVDLSSLPTVVGNQMANSLAGQTAVQWAYPRIEGRDIAFRHGPPTVAGPWQIAEPSPIAPICQASDLDVVIVPGLGFDMCGHRLGYGAGYYDRALANTSALRIGVCFREQRIDMIPTTSSDISMSHLVCDDHDGAAVVHILGANP